ncbi:MAG: hypothetical protein J6W29_01615, partial [Neisseriaceae bacterium]|nr:hypothetical protein [Neisseriaceae bacterium]
MTENAFVTQINHYHRFECYFPDELKFKIYHYLIIILLYLICYPAFKQLFEQVYWIIFFAIIFVCVIVGILVFTLKMYEYRGCMK